MKTIFRKKSKPLEKAHNKMTPPEISIVGSGDQKNEFQVRVASSKLSQILGPSFSYKIRAKF